MKKKYSQKMIDTKKLFILILLALGVIPLFAKTIKIGIRSEHQSVDPHFSRTSPNQNTASHIFESLGEVDKNMQVRPKLAESWKNTKKNVWEIKLRKGVKFHDGSDFDADDVISTFKRIPKVENSPASFLGNISGIESVKKKDKYTILVTTKDPRPDLMNSFGLFYILPSELGTDLKSSSFDKGTSAIGTGPWKFVSWNPNESLVLQANKNYWGGKPYYDEAVLRFIPNDAARVAALLAGDVDAIDSVPPSDIKVINKGGRAKVGTSVSGRLIYLHMDSNREKTPFVKGKNGKEIKNPLLDKRVRKALSLMIDREAISKRIMEGLSVPTGQFVPEGFSGYSPDIKVPAANPGLAKKLLKEAGYPDGFSVVIQGPNDRYQNDSKILQAISQLFARNGLKSSVEAMPKNIFFKKASDLEFSLFLIGFGTTTGTSLHGMKQVIATYDKAAKVGGFNRGRYSNPKLDKILQQASKTFDDSEREKLLKEASGIAFVEEQAIIPIHFEKLIFAYKKNIVHEVRPVERTLAQDFSEKP